MPEKGTVRMPATARRIAFLGVVGIVALCFAQATLTNDSIIRSVKEGLGEDLVVTAIQTQPGKYATGLDDMTALKAAGVSEKIIKAMIARSNSSNAPSTTTAVSNENSGALTQKGPELEFQGTVYWLDQGNNKLNPLGAC
jgi:hypothetical protein